MLSRAEWYSYKRSEVKVKQKTLYLPIFSFCKLRKVSNMLSFFPMLQEMLEQLSSIKWHDPTKTYLSLSYWRYVVNMDSHNKSVKSHDNNIVLLVVIVLLC